MKSRRLSAIILAAATAYLCMGEAVKGQPAAESAAVPYVPPDVRVTVDDIVPMPERQNHPNPKPVDPQAVTFVKVRLWGTATSIDVKYTQIATDTLVGYTIEDLINRVMRRQYTPNWRTPKFEQEEGDATSRLSIRNKLPSYIVFILDCGNCQFSTGSLPFRVERGKAKHHFDARTAWMTTSGPEHENAPTENAKAKIGYFIAYSDKDFLENGSAKFRSHFNIYVELTYGDSRPVPISIDPDVGYPGGNR